MNSQLTVFEESSMQYITVISLDLDFEVIPSITILPYSCPPASKYYSLVRSRMVPKVEFSGISFVD